MKPAAQTPPALIVSSHVPIPDELLAPAPHHFNPGLTGYGPGFLLTTRAELGDDRTKSFIAAMTAELVPQPGHEIRFFGHRNEDVRLFWHRGRLHAAYTCCDGAVPKQHLCEITPDGQCSHARCVSLHADEPEKNLQFFEHDGELFCVHTISPRHVVLRVSGGVKGAVQVVGDTPTSFEWPYGEPRGGTPPVQIGDEYWSFFHSYARNEERRLYFAGAYAFAARPPFAVTRMSCLPLFIPGPKRHLEHRIREYWQGLCHVVFPGGCVLRDDEFIVAYGHNDLEACLVRLPVAAVVASTTAR